MYQDVFKKEKKRRSVFIIFTPETGWLVMCGPVGKMFLAYGLRQSVPQCSLITVGGLKLTTLVSQMTALTTVPWWPVVPVTRGEPGPAAPGTRKGKKGLLPPPQHPVLSACCLLGSITPRCWGQNCILWAWIPPLQTVPGPRGLVVQFNPQLRA